MCLVMARPTFMASFMLLGLKTATTRLYRFTSKGKNWKKSIGKKHIVEWKFFFWFFKGCVIKMALSQLHDIFIMPIRYYLHNTNILILGPLTAVNGCVCLPRSPFKLFCYYSFRVNLLPTATAPHRYIHFIFF